MRIKVRNSKKVFKDVQWRALPKPFSTWDKIVVNKGDLTFADLIKHLETQHSGLVVESIFKRNITKKEVEAGMGINLWSKSNPFAMASVRAQATLALPTTTNNQLRLALQRDIDNFNNYEKKKDESVAKRYLSVYGNLITADRNYFFLEGNYANKAGERVVLPPILFVFKAGSWVEKSTSA